VIGRRGHNSHLSFDFKLCLDSSMRNDYHILVLRADNVNGTIISSISIDNRISIHNQFQKTKLPL